MVLLCAMSASAQSASPSNPWRHGTTLNVFTGGARAETDNQFLLGGAMGWEITPTLAIEGSGYWFDRNTEPDAFAAALKLQAGLPVGRPVVPFVAAGIGLYLASFDATTSTIPDFYRNRIASTGTSAGSVHTFTDPSFIAAGGVNLFVSRHVSIRPDVEAMFVRANSQGYLVMVAAVHVAYHFENHPMTR
jgi:hypothetical protein